MDRRNFSAGAYGSERNLDCYILKGNLHCYPFHQQTLQVKWFWEDFISLFSLSTSPRAEAGFRGWPVSICSVGFALSQHSAVTAEAKATAPGMLWGHSQHLKPPGDKPGPAVLLLWQHSPAPSPKPSFSSSPLRVCRLALCSPPLQALMFMLKIKNPSGIWEVANELQG